MYVLQWNGSTNVSNMFQFIECSGFSCNIKEYEKKKSVILESKNALTDSSWFNEHSALWKKCLNATIVGAEALTLEAMSLHN